MCSNHLQELACFSALHNAFPHTPPWTAERSALVGRADAADGKATEVRQALAETRAAADRAAKDTGERLGSLVPRLCLPCGTGIFLLVRLTRATLCFAGMFSAVACLRFAYAHTVALATAATQTPWLPGTRHPLLSCPAVLSKHLELLRGSSRDAAKQLEADRKRYREHLATLRSQLAAFRAHLSAATAEA